MVRSEAQTVNSRGALVFDHRTVAGRVSLRLSIGRFSLSSNPPRASVQLRATFSDAFAYHMR